MDLSTGLIKLINMKQEDLENSLPGTEEEKTLVHTIEVLWSIYDKNEQLIAEISQKDAELDFEKEKFELEHKLAKKQAVCDNIHKFFTATVGLGGLALNALMFGSVMAMSNDGKIIYPKDAMKYISVKTK